MKVNNFLSLNQIALLSLKCQLMLQLSGKPPEIGKEKKRTLHYSRLKKSCANCLYKFRKKNYRKSTVESVKVIFGWRLLFI